MDLQEQEIAQLEQQLRESAAAENFFNTASGKLIVELINKKVNLSLKKITSSKFEKDHMGYVNELAHLNAHKQLLKELQIAGSPIRKQKIQEKLDGHQQ